MAGSYYGKDDRRNEIFKCKCANFRSWLDLDFKVKVASINIIGKNSPGRPPNNFDASHSGSIVVHSS